MTHRKKESGFTLIELMIVVIILGILFAVAAPKFGDLIRKSKEGTTKGSLGALRSALSISYAQNEGVYPVSISTAPFVGTFIESVPKAKLADHAESAAVKTGGGVDDAGGWYYDPATGQVCVNCTHQDSNGTTISSW